MQLVAPVRLGGIPNSTNERDDRGNGISVQQLMSGEKKKFLKSGPPPISLSKLSIAGKVKSMTRCETSIPLRQDSQPVRVHEKLGCSLYFELGSQLWKVNPLL